MARSRIEAHFESQAKACEALGSPFTAAVCRAAPTLLSQPTETAAKLLHWPGEPAADALALRLCGGFNALVLSAKDAQLVAAYPPDPAEGERLTRALALAVLRNDAFLAGFLASPPQTNEIARSAMLLPGLLHIARQTGLPVALAEIGSSGGLNLNLDRFAYDYAGLLRGDPRSPVRLAPEVRGPTPDLDGNLRIVARQGCDIAPVDVSDPAERLRLRAYVWPDQPARIARLDAALSVANQHPYELAASDAEAFVATALSERRDGEAFVLMHSIMWQYMPEAKRQAIAAVIAQAGAKASPQRPLAWLRMEPLSPSDGFATLQLDLWPQGGGTRALARCDYHGRWIERLE